DLQATSGSELRPARVARVDRAAVTVITAEGPERVRLSGRLFHADDSAAASGTPTVGDWVALDGLVAIAILPRRSAFERGAASGEAVAQLVAANVDTVFVVAPLVGRARPRLLQRCVALGWQAGATPVVVLTKKDLADDAADRVAATRADAVGVDVHVVSAVTGDGLDELDRYLQPGHTFAMIGPSGAGKSTLANALADGAVALPTGGIRDDGKGRHTTVARELVMLPSGAVAIDTPGLRGLALWGADDGIAAAFSDVESFAQDCRFADCRHDTEPGCAVVQAISDGDLAASRLSDYNKLLREQRWQESRRYSRLRAQERARVKAFAKSVRGLPHH
ncbi:MAG TPA: ribosome small subunit-dependent GTPase A, partial [Acidothermaceae bacterium]|nr:ribosome small subunit-dependent GTPase A [Acidothermaceae bacterium]